MRGYRLLSLALVLAASLAIYYYTAGASELLLLRDASVHAQEHAQVRHDALDAREDGGGALRAAGTPSIHLSVKTTAGNHDTRLAVMMLTWMKSVPDPAQVHIITSGADERWRRVVTGAGFILRNTSCTTDHSRTALWCKSGAEYTAYFQEMETGKRKSWFCHFDDDIYVNFPRLAEVLTSYSPTGRERVYLGLLTPKRRNRPLMMGERRLRKFPKYKQHYYQFAAGAVYCISPALMHDMAAFMAASTSRTDLFVATCEKLGSPDDTCVGAIMGALLGVNLTQVENMKSHLQDMRSIPAHKYKEQVTVSFKGSNVLRIPNSTFSKQDDPTQFLSYHCFLHPETAWCRDPPRVREGGRTASALYHRVAAASNLQL